MNRPALALLAAATIAGCGSDSSTAPVPHSLDVSAEISAMANGSVNGLAGVSSLLSLPASSTLPTVFPSACAYSTATQGFTCPTAVSNGLTFDISYFLADVSGRSQTAPDVNSTASIRAVADTRGTEELPSTAGTLSSVTLTDHSDMTMSNLLGSNRLLNGTSTSHFDVTTTGAATIHALVDAATTTANVALAQEGAAAAWPSTGTVTTNVTAVTSVGFLPSVITTAKSVVTFNGTSTPTVVVTAAGVVRTCKIDLAGRTAPTCT
jgi:hypothetical protein